MNLFDALSRPIQSNHASDIPRITAPVQAAALAATWPKVTPFANPALPKFAAQMALRVVDVVDFYRKGE